MIGLAGLKGKPVAAICTAHQISQSPDYQGRDQFLANAAHAFEVHQPPQSEARLEQETARLKNRVGERLLE